MTADDLRKQAKECRGSARRAAGEARYWLARGRETWALECLLDANEWRDAAAAWAELARRVDPSQR